MKNHEDQVNIMYSLKMFPFNTVKCLPEVDKQGSITLSAWISDIPKSKNLIHTYLFFIKKRTRPPKKQPFSCLCLTSMTLFIHFLRTLQKTLLQWRAVLCFANCHNYWHHFPLEPWILLFFRMTLYFKILVEISKWPWRLTWYLSIAQQFLWSASLFLLIATPTSALESELVLMATSSEDSQSTGSEILNSSCCLFYFSCYKSSLLIEISSSCGEDYANCIS